MNLKAKVYCRMAKSFFYLKKYQDAKEYIKLFMETNPVIDPAIPKMLAFIESGMVQEKTNINH